MTWVLTRLDTNNRSQQFIIDRDMVIGRHANADIILDSQEVSRKHAGIGLNDMGIYIIDLGSSNGTFVNNQAISGEYQLTAGDYIRFANIEFQLTSQEPTTAIKNETSDNNSNVEQEHIAQQMNEQGMPSLSERAKNTQINREGMPQNISIPKPAPIPEGVDVNQVQTVEMTSQDQISSDIEQEKEQQKSAYVGLISIIILIIIAIIVLFIIM